MFPPLSLFWYHSFRRNLLLLTINPWVTVMTLCNPPNLSRDRWLYFTRRILVIGSSIVCPDWLSRIVLLTYNLPDTISLNIVERSKRALCTPPVGELHSTFFGRSDVDMYNLQDGHVGDIWGCSICCSQQSAMFARVSTLCLELMGYLILLRRAFE